MHTSRSLQGRSSKTPPDQGVPGADNAEGVKARARSHTDHVAPAIPSRSGSCAKMDIGSDPLLTAGRGCAESRDSDVFACLLDRHEGHGSVETRQDPFCISCSTWGLSASAPGAFPSTPCSAFQARPVYPCACLDLQEMLSDQNRSRRHVDHGAYSASQSTGVALVGSMPRRTSSSRFSGHSSGKRQAGSHGASSPTQGRRPRSGRRTF